MKYLIKISGIFLMVGIVHNGVLGSAQAVLLTPGVLDTVFLLHLFLALLGNRMSYDYCSRNKVISILAASIFQYKWKQFSMQGS